MSVNTSESDELFLGTTSGAQALPAVWAFSWATGHCPGSSNGDCESTVAQLTEEQISGRMAWLLLNYQSVKILRKVVFSSSYMPPMAVSANQRGQFHSY